MFVGIAYEFVNGFEPNYLYFLAMGVAPLIIEHVCDHLRIGWPRQVEITVKLRW